VLTVEPLKVPDGPDGALLVADWVGVAVFVGVDALVVAGAVVVVVWAGVVAGAAVVVLVVAFVLVDFVADGLVVGGFSVGVVPLADADGDVADADGVIGVLSAVMVGTWVLYEKSAASPATVPPRAKTARRMEPLFPGLPG